MPLESLDVTVPPEAIERALASLPAPEQAQDELLRFARAQPELFTFVRQAAAPLGEDGLGQAVYLAFAVCRAFELAFPGEVRRVPADELQDACAEADAAMRAASAEEEKQRLPLERLPRAAASRAFAPPAPGALASTAASDAPLVRAFSAAAFKVAPIPAPAGPGALEDSLARVDAPGEFFQRQPHLHAFIAPNAQGDLFLLGAGIVEAFHRLMQERAVEEMVRRADKTVRRTEPRIGRNDACPCGSGKKYKFCHGA